jgi:flagellar motor switch protein FliN
MTAAPYHWVKKIEHSLAEAEKIPLWGNLPVFPWELCAQQLQTRLSIPALTLRHQNTEWRSASELLEGMGKSPMHITCELAPLSGHIHWIFSQEDVGTLISHSLAQEALSKGFSDKGLEEGYFSFLSIQAMQAIDTTGAFPNLSLKLAPKGHLPKEGALCIDINIEMHGKSLWGRLVCPGPFLHALRRYFQGQPFQLNSETSRNIDVDLHMQVGLTRLPLSDLKTVKIGDVIILDRCAVDPQTKKGGLIVALYTTPLFQASISDTQVKITDYSYYQEDTSMAKEPFDDEDAEIEDEDEEFDDDEEFEDDEEFDEDEDEEEYEDDDEIEDKLQEAQAPAWSSDVETSAVENAIATSKIPITLTVELAKIRMNLEKVLELKPGNVLNLQTSIDKPVDVRMNGKIIAHGELIKMGDMLGVKILDVGAI